MRSQNTEGIDVISRSGKSNRKFTSWTNIDWSWFGKVRVYFLAMSPPQSGHPCVPKSTSICVISCRTLWQENNNPRSFGFILTYSLLKDCIKNCHSFCYVFILKWKKDKLFFIMKCFRNPDSSYWRIAIEKVGHMKSYNEYTSFWCHFKLGRYLIYCVKYLINQR